MRVSLRIPYRMIASDRRAEKRFSWASNTEVAPNLWINDISREGCQLVHGGELTSGKTLTLDIPMIGPTEARVAWSVGRSAGCEFASRLDGRMLRKLISSQEQVSGFGRRII